MRSTISPSSAQSLPPVERVEVTSVRVSRVDRNRITTSYATLPDAHHALVRVHAGGLVGIGEAPAELWWTGEDAASVENAIVSYLAPAVVGCTGVREAADAMEAALAANSYAKAAIEMALWDLLGKAADLPLRTVLGGSHAHRRVPIKYVIGVREPSAAAEELQYGRELGFDTFKLKVGGNLESDLARVELLAGSLKPSERLGVDANGGWSHRTARAALPRLEELGVCFWEQPVSARYPESLADLTARTSIPVVAHESIVSLRDGMQAATARWADVWAITPSTHGGLLETIDLLGLARAAGLGCLLGSTVELGVATAFLAQVGAAFDELREGAIPSDVIGPIYHESEIITDALVIADGYVHAPDGPGLGVALDDGAVASAGGATWR